MDDDDLIIKNRMPYSLDAERAALGAALSSQDAIYNVVDNLRAEDFYENAHKIIFTAISDFYKTNSAFSIDPVNFKHFLIQKGELEACGGIDYIIKLMQSAPASSNVDSYIKIVKEKSIRRMIINQSDAMHSQALDEKIAADVTLDQYVHNLIELSSSGEEDYVNIRDVLEEQEAKFENRIGKKLELGIKTGFTKIDRATHGLKAGQLVVVAARPGVGKTSFALSCILNMVKQTVSKFTLDENGREVEYRKQVVPGFFSYEMALEDILNRILSSVSNVSATDIINNTIKPQSREHESIHNAYKYLFDRNIAFKYAAGMHLREISTQCRKMQRNGVDVVFIDYLSLINIDDLGTRNSTTSEKIGIITRTLKLLSMELKMPIVLLVQLNREAENSVPTMANLRDSGAIEQDADIIIFLHNPDKNKAAESISKSKQKNYSSDEEESEEVYTKDGIRTQRVVAILAKHRNGATGAYDLCYVPNIMTYTNYEEEYS